MFNVFYITVYSKVNLCFLCKKNHAEPGWMFFTKFTSNHTKFKPHNAIGIGQRSLANLFCGWSVVFLWQHIVAKSRFATPVSKWACSCIYSRTKPKQGSCSGQQCRKSHVWTSNYPSAEKRIVQIFGIGFWPVDKLEVYVQVIYFSL